MRSATDKTPADPTLAVPRGLSRAGRAAAQAILEFLRARGALDTGWCRAFYTPAEWRKRGEKYGLKSELIVVHDGGGLAPWFNADYDVGAYRLVEEMGEALEKVGVYAEACTSWYTAICNMER